MKTQFVSIILLSAVSVFADVSIRVPILLESSQGNHNVSEFKKELSAVNLSIPDYVVIKSVKDQKKLDKISQDIDSADIQVKLPGRKKESLALVQFGTISTYQTKGVKFPICYTYSGLSLQQASREALDLVAGLGDGVLSDQYSIVAVRFYDEREFAFESADDGEQGDWLNKKYGKTKLKAGDIQIIATTNDSGDDDSEDILSLCKK